jgi:serine/threonine-protein kinase
VSSPAVVNGVVYIGSFDGNVSALDPRAAGLLWRFATENFVVSSPAVVNAVVYVGSSDDNLYAFTLPGLS